MKSVDIVSSHRFASHVLIHDGRYVAFGEEPTSDFVKIGKVKSSKESGIFYDETTTESTIDSRISLLKSILDLSDPALMVSFRLNPWHIKFIQKTIKIFSATHITFFGDENGLQVNFYDVLKLIPEARMNRNHETRMLTHVLKEGKFTSFKMTFNAASVILLPTRTLDVGIGKNHVGIFTDDDADETYLIRDLEVEMPLINFFSDRLGQDISLSLSANHLSLDPNTIPHETLLSEFETEDL